MKIVEEKRIKSINKNYYKVIKMICDKCNKEIKENDLYLIASYKEDKWDEYFLHKDFCENCIKDGMYEIFINNDTFYFIKYYFHKNNEWGEIDKHCLEEYDYKVQELEDK